MLPPNKNPLYVTLVQDEQIARIHHKTVERLQQEGVKFAGPFHTWHEVLLWKVSVWMTMFTTGQADERAEDERGRCEICGGREGLHDFECALSCNAEPVDIDPDAEKE